MKFHKKSNQGRFSKKQRQSSRTMMHNSRFALSSGERPEGVPPAQLSYMAKFIAALFGKRS